MSDPTGFDLEAYLERVGYTGDREPSHAALAALHLAHATHIPFENLDVLLRQPIRLDLESLQAKMVRGGRGGYCFEQNTLFAAALDQLGFSVRRLAARVRARAHRVLPRTHMLLLVDIGVSGDGGTWLADVGFGAEGLLLPVPFGDRQEARQFAWTYRVVAEEPGLWVLQSLRGDIWEDLYAFTHEPQKPIDYEMAHYYTSTHPESRFLHTLTVQLAAPEGRRILRDRELLLDRGTLVTSRPIADDEEFLAVLAETFGLRFPPGTRFRYDPL
ncbi:MAG TPA: arylamine N-acetyltransferase [Thermoanaerobaculia bacterium]|jgi:N-hydroxyarylamine O-acetyltransferase|nr:arylamine N-acetyltransferase [Thermoanaerobaculia bacterium]